MAAGGSSLSCPCQGNLGENGQGEGRGWDGGTRGDVVGMWGGVLTIFPPEKDVKLSNRKDICACQVDSVNPVTLML